MPSSAADNPSPGSTAPYPSRHQWLLRLVHLHAQGWASGAGHSVEGYLRQGPDLQGDPRAVLDLIGHEILVYRDRGRP